jgi:integrase
MAQVTNRLSRRQVAEAVPPKGRDAVMLPDGGNLFLQCRRAADGRITRSWTFRYELRGVRHEMGLGALHTRDVREARAEARRLRQLLVDGRDPLDERNRAIAARAAEQAKDKTFAEVAAAYIEAHRPGWSSPEHARQWHRSLFEDARPLLHLSVAAIDTAHVLDVLRPIWRTKPTTATRTRGRIEQVLAAAIIAGYRTPASGNPADRSVQALLGKTSAAIKAKRERTGRDHHMPALPYDQVPQLMAELRAIDSPAARALEMAILTCTRTSELRGAVTAEFDLMERVWCIPARRMKSRKPHRVPLADRALEILRELPARDDARLFPVGKQAMLALLQRLRPGTTVHGCARASFKTWAGERTNYPREIVEASLAHRLGDDTEAAYERGDKLEKRRRLMRDWGVFCCAKPATTGAAVVPLRAAT